MGEQIGLWQDRGLCSHHLPCTSLTKVHLQQMLHSQSRSAARRSGTLQGLSGSALGPTSPTESSTNPS